MSIIQEFFASVNVSQLIKIALNALATIIIANIVLNIVYNALKKSEKISKTLVNFAYPVFKFLIYFLVFIIIANDLGFDTSSLVALASVLSAAIALAAQNILSNLFGGLTLIINHPFEIDDFISVSGYDGTVYSVGAFYTVLKTVDNKTITIPNGIVSSSSIVNYSIEGKRRIDLVISASYNCPIDAVKEAIAKAIIQTKHVLNEDQFVRLSRYGSSSIEYTIKVWSKTEHYWNVYFDLLENIKRCFDQDGIEMTYDHIIVHQSKD